MKNRTADVLAATAAAPKPEAVVDDAAMLKRLQEMQDDPTMDYDKFMQEELMRDGFDMQNNRVFEKMVQDLDISAGNIITETESIAEVGTF